MLISVFISLIIFLFREERNSRYPNVTISRNTKKRRVYITRSVEVIGSCCWNLTTVDGEFITFDHVNYILSKPMYFNRVIGQECPKN